MQLGGVKKAKLVMGLTVVVLMDVGVLLLDSAAEVVLRPAGIRNVFD